MNAAESVDPREATLQRHSAAPRAQLVEFSDHVRDFADLFETLDVPAHDLTEVEGYRLFLRYLTIGIDQFVEYSDPENPAFYQKTRDGVRKFAGDSPAQLYDTSTLSGAHEYVVTGNMADTVLFEATTYAGDLSGKNAVQRRLVDSITEEDLDLAADGSFTITLGKGAHGRNHLLVDGETSVVAIRRYLRDPLRDSPRPLSIKRVSGAVVPAAVSADTLGAGMVRAAQFAAFNVRNWSQWVDRNRKDKTNTLSPMDDAGDIFTPLGHKYLNGYWSVPAGHMLRVSFRPKEGEYWSFVPMNYWMESLEWRFGNRVYATSLDTQPGADGVVELALSAEDPAIPGVTWLETLGHEEGAMAFRFARCSGELPTPSVELVQIG